MSEVVSRKTVDEILEEVNQLDINDIQLDQKAQKFLNTVEAYLKCFEELQALYEATDPSHKLANYDMPDIKLPIQQLSNSGEPVKNLAELYEVAEAMFPVFVRKVEGLLQQAATSSGPEESSKAKFKLPPGENKLKGKERASEKAQDDYSKKVPGPPESWLYDIVRGSVLFENADQLFQFLERLRADESVRIVKSKNRFRKPTLSGYRDFNLQIQIINAHDGMKHICELQLHIGKIKEADTTLGSHDFYDFFRKYYAGELDSLKERMDDLKVICKGGSLDVAFISQVIENPLEVGRMTRLANLFKEYMNEFQLAIMITNATKGSLEPQIWYGRMANILQEQGKLKEAMKLHEQALEILLNVVGPDHRDVADYYNNMAIVLRGVGKLEEAIETHQKSLDIRLKALGADHTEVANSFNNMAVILQDQGKLDDAMKMHQQALDIRLKALGLDHTEVASSYINMASTLQNQSKLEEAMKMYQNALDCYLKALGPDHTDVANCHNNMANILQNQGQLEEAMKLHQKALNIRLKAFGPDHSNVANCYNNVAVILYQQGKLEEAMTMFQKALDIRLTALGPGHTLVASSYNNMANILTNQGKLEEAMKMHQKALDSVSKALGPDHSRLAYSYTGMAVILTHQGKLEGARKAHQKALDIRIKALGPAHSDVAVSNYNIGEVLFKQGKLEESAEFVGKAHSLFLQFHGPDHPYTAASTKLMDMIREKTAKGAHNRCTVS